MPHASSGLYPKLLGNSWSSLDDTIRRLHDSGGVVRAVGAFQIHQGRNRWARALARLVRLPAAGAAVQVGLQITSRGEGETWQRTFAGRPLVSMQSRRADGLLVERIGIVEMHFQLEIVDRTLSYQTVSAALCFGSFCVPLPHCLSPCITAWERPVDDKTQIDVSVDVNFPIVGRLIAYQGMLTRVQEQG